MRGDEITVDVKWAQELRQKLLEPTGALRNKFEAEVNALFRKRIDEIVMDKDRKLPDDILIEEIRKIISERDRCLGVWERGATASV